MMNFTQLREHLAAAQSNAGNVNTQLHIADLITQIDAVVGDASAFAAIQPVAQGDEAVPSRPTQATYRLRRRRDHRGRLRPRERQRHGDPA